jgi:hypothetical protein
MPESLQPTAGSLSAVVIHACRHPECPQYLKLDCPEHVRKEDLGVIASFETPEVAP